METIAVEDATLIETAITVTALASGFADMVKKSVFHGHPLNRDAALTALTALSAAATDALQFVWLMEDENANR